MGWRGGLAVAIIRRKQTVLFSIELKLSQQAWSTGVSLMNRPAEQG